MPTDSNTTSATLPTALHQSVVAGKLKQGDLANPHWRLVKLTDLTAEFQNLKFADLKHRIDAVELQGRGAGAAISNDF